MGRKTRRPGREWLRTSCVGASRQDNEGNEGSGESGTRCSISIDCIPSTAKRRLHSTSANDQVVVAGLSVNDTTSRRLQMLLT